MILIYASWLWLLELIHVDRCRVGSLRQSLVFFIACFSHVGHPWKYPWMCFSFILKPPSFFFALFHFEGYFGFILLPCFGLLECVWGIQVVWAFILTQKFVVISDKIWLGILGLKLLLSVTLDASVLFWIHRFSWWHFCFLISFQ